MQFNNVNYQPSPSFLPYMNNIKIMIIISRHFFFLSLCYKSDYNTKSFRLKTYNYIGLKMKKINDDLCHRFIIILWSVIGDSLNRIIERLKC